MSLNWKRSISLGFSVFALLIGSVGIVGCEQTGEVEQEEVETEQGGEVEVEED